MLIALNHSPAVPLVHQARGDIKAAEADLLQALQRNPAWVPGLVNLADLYRATGRDVMAGGLLRQALALAPEGRSGAGCHGAMAGAARQANPGH